MSEYDRDGLGMGWGWGGLGAVKGWMEEGVDVRKNAICNMIMLRIFASLDNCGYVLLDLRASQA